MQTEISAGDKIAEEVLLIDEKHAPYMEEHVNEIALCAEHLMTLFPAETKDFQFVVESKLRNKVHS